MEIEGYEVICYGVRVNNGKQILKRVCRDCTLYTKSINHTVKPTWRAFGFTTRNKYKCKIKELYGKPKE